ncbi:maestro heat-like repeat-containing protein family member 7, partial [Chiloscyllium plagiosum]|uniref:maestro heat-like repeat-containing protein family member 7 n=1 Tax=Chiloscyllium plagiosum TaxID=36176 RepID=UPI001CB86672
MMEEEKGWDLMRSPESHHQGVAVLARAMAQHGVTHLSSIVEQLAPMLSSPYEGQRVTTVAFFGEVSVRASCCRQSGTPLPLPPLHSPPSPMIIPAPPGGQG